MSICMIGCEASKEILLGIMLFSIIPVVSGADGTPWGALGTRVCQQPHLSLCTIIRHPSRTDKFKPPLSPDIKPQRPLDVYYSAVNVAVRKNI